MRVSLAALALCAPLTLAACAEVVEAPRDPGVCYSVVVTDDGRNIERVGYYNPVAQGAEARIVLDIPKVDAWVANGAQLTDKVRNLYKEATKAQAAAA